MRKLTNKVFLLFGLLLLMSFVSVNAQEKQVTGVVKDSETGVPIPGVNILIKNTSRGTTTNFDGAYTIDANANDVLVFTYLGYKSLEQTVGNQTTINVSLTIEASQLDEVVVVGYGTQKRTNVTSSVATVDMEEALGDRPVSSTAQVLQGTSPGLEIVTGSGRPGQGSSINIRGFTSINGGDPLILVDDAEVPSIDDINPNDIESVSVLKDAAAASIYGARGAFGVVLITTKKGRRNTKPTVNYSVNTAMTYGTDLPEKLGLDATVRKYQEWEIQNKAGRDVDTWVSFLDDYAVNPSNYPEGFAVDQFGTNYPLRPTRDWWDLAFTEGLETIHNFDYSGGSENTNYRVSVGYTDQDGILITGKDSYKRYNLNATLNTDLSDQITMSASFFYKNDLRKTPNVMWRAFGYGVLTGPWANSGYYDDAQTGESIPYATPNNFLRLEPVVRDFGDDIRLNGSLTWKPLDGLSFRSAYTFNKTTNNRNSVTTGSVYKDPVGTQDVIFGQNTNYYKSTNTVNYHSLNLRANYEKAFGDHNFGAMIGLNYEKAEREGFNASRQDLINIDLPALSTATGQPFVGDSYYDWAVAGYFARVNYNYKEKYLLELSSRYDGSSRFAKGDRYVFLPSASAGWVVTNESFMEALKPAISYLKFRGSYGEIGNQRVTRFGVQDYYPYLPTYPVGESEWVNDENINFVTLFAPQLVSAGFTWETVRTLDVGAELAFFNNRLSSTFSWYQRETLGMLNEAIELPTVLGTGAPLQNAADLETKGWDLTLEWKDRIGENFKYSIGGNLYDSRSYITRVENQSGTIDGLYVGKELGELWGYEADGLYSVDNFEEAIPGAFTDFFTLKDGIAPFENRDHLPGDVRFKDLNGDGVVNDGLRTLEDHGDLRRIGNNRRRYQYGITGSAAYKSFSLSFFLQGVGKRNRNIYTPVMFPIISEFYSGILTHQADAWSAENQDAFYPRILSRNYGLAGTPNSRYLFDVSYLTIKNISLAYELPRAFLDKMNIKKLRLSLSGENLYTFDNLPKGVASDLQAESAGAGYPLLRKYSLGINVSF
ncbi:TonB-linked outer membrane protein, SusC/RagA family [Zhouia amylolytica]|uniref:TonB-linked outer membrane protein, SusC/RagA family n=1 Tax=Zhouia amylolytica TaxID=376730 RepID=A0A1I6V3J2_9FLAO|nr:TonB-dependent receptor [Zhouia amylolytica]SFT08214.1 TonB-linked outer membrane protein, SusC/RagA family [Zhouia amylolytica]